MKISPAKAIRQFDVSKPTLYKDMKEGKVSYEIKDKKRKIDVAELTRVYEPRKGAGGANTNTADENKNTVSSSNEMIPMSAVDKLMNSQKEQYESHIETLTKALEKAQEGQNGVTKLLENHSTEERESHTAWEESLNATKKLAANNKSRLINQVKRSKKLIEQSRGLKAKNERLERELERRNKGFWSRLFG